MAPKVGDIVNAHCSHCKVDVDAQIAAAAGEEIVTVTCRTCGTSQRYRGPEGEGQRNRKPPAGRRVVDVSSSGKGRASKRPRAARRVVSTTGREIPEMPPPRPVYGDSDPAAVQARTKKRRDSTLFRKWDEVTDGVAARDARPHRKQERYTTGEYIVHTEYGMGLIEESLPDGSLKVLFRDGYEILPAKAETRRDVSRPGASDLDADSEE